MDSLPLTFRIKKMLQAKQELEYSLKISAQFIGEITFGMPSKNCANFGICRIDIMGKEESKGSCTGKRSKGIISLFCKNYLEMDFLKHSMSMETINRYFSMPTFLVLEDYAFDYENFQIIIPKGEYPIMESNSMIKVIFHF